MKYADKQKLSPEERLISCRGEVLDAVFDAESLKEDNQVSEVLDEVVIAFVGFDVAQEDYVISKIEHAFCMGQHDNCC